MTDFKAKMHQIRFRLGSAPDPAGGAYSAPPDENPRWIWGPLRGRGWAVLRNRRERWKGREGEVEGREREGPKLMLNQGPSEPCYATVNFVTPYSTSCRLRRICLMVGHWRTCGFLTHLSRENAGWYSRNCERNVVILNFPNVNKIHRRTCESEVFKLRTCICIFKYNVIVHPVCISNMLSWSAIPD